MRVNTELVVLARCVRWRGGASASKEGKALQPEKKLYSRSIRAYEKRKGTCRRDGTSRRDGGLFGLGK
eukprot:4727989-Prymnesium_polylepis.1